MMKLYQKRWFAYLFVISYGVLLSACMSGKVIPTVAQANDYQNIAVFTPYTMPTESPTAVLARTRTLFPSPTKIFSISPSLTPTPTVTSKSLPVSRSTPTSAFQERCAVFENKVPDDTNLLGNLIFRTLRGVYYYDTNSMQKRLFPVSFEGTRDLTISPNRKWLAYTKIAISSNGYTATDRYLHVIDSEGRQVDLSYWIINWQYLLGWVDDQRISLEIPPYPDGTVTILNPFTGQYLNSSYSLPDLSSHGLISHNSDLSGFIYVSASEWGNDTIIYNLATGRLVWKGHTWEELQWFSDGSQVVVLSSNIGQDDRLLSVNIERGEIKKLVGAGSLGISSKRISSIGEFALSPDDKFISVWLSYQTSSTSYTKSLVLIDLVNNRIVDTCMQSDGYVGHAPVWSPDSQWLAVSYLVREEMYSYAHKMVLLNTNSMKAYELTDGIEPIVWMAAP